MFPNLLSVDIKPNSFNLLESCFLASRTPNFKVFGAHWKTLIGSIIRHQAIGRVTTFVIVFRVYVCLWYRFDIDKITFPNIKPRKNLHLLNCQRVYTKSYQSVCSELMLFRLAFGVSLVGFDMQNHPTHTHTKQQQRRPQHIPPITVTTSSQLARK